jgi:hypothetical protein
VDETKLSPSAKTTANVELGKYEVISDNTLNESLYQLNEDCENENGQPDSELNTYFLSYKLKRLLREHELSASEYCQRAFNGAVLTSYFINLIDEYRDWEQLSPVDKAIFMEIQTASSTSLCKLKALAEEVTSTQSSETSIVPNKITRPRVSQSFRLSLTQRTAVRLTRLSRIYRPGRGISSHIAAKKAQLQQEQQNVDMDEEEEAEIEINTDQLGKKVNELIAQLGITRVVLTKIANISSLSCLKSILHKPKSWNTMTEKQQTNVRNLQSWLHQNEPTTRRVKSSKSSKTKQKRTVTSGKR